MNGLIWKDDGTHMTMLVVRDRMPGLELGCYKLDRSRKRCVGRHMPWAVLTRSRRDTLVAGVGKHAQSVDRMMWLLSWRCSAFVSYVATVDIHRNCSTRLQLEFLGERGHSRCGLNERKKRDSCPCMARGRWLRHRPWLREVDIRGKRVDRPLAWLGEPSCPPLLL